MGVFWDVALSHLVDSDQHFRGVYCLHYEGGDVAMRTSNIIKLQVLVPVPTHCLCMAHCSAGIHQNDIVC
jgi:hypothetical protein